MDVKVVEAREEEEAAEAAAERAERELFEQRCAILAGRPTGVVADNNRNGRAGWDSVKMKPLVQHGSE